MWTRKQVDFVLLFETVKKGDQRVLLILAGVVALILWVVPFGRWLLYPLIIYNTHIHELCHALVGAITGGAVHSIEVRPDGSGVTLIAGGSRFLTASAGYVGSAVVGGILMMGALGAKGARLMLTLAAVFLGVALLLWVRGNPFGIVSALVWIAALGAASKWLPDRGAVFAAQFLGFQMCLTSAHAFLALVSISQNSHAMTDAKAVESLTGLPAMLWAGIWMLIAGAFSGVALVRAWRATNESGPAA